MSRYYYPGTRKTCTEELVKLKYSYIKHHVKQIRDKFKDTGIRTKITTGIEFKETRGIKPTYDIEIHLDYVKLIWHSKGENRDQVIRMESKKLPEIGPNMIHTRFICPLCGRRCMEVYTKTTEFFACRLCLNLSNFTTQSNYRDKLNQNYYKIIKIIKLLGYEGEYNNIDMPYIEQPEGMSLYKYNTLIEKLESLYRENSISFYGRINKYFNRNLPLD